MDQLDHLDHLDQQEIRRMLEKLLEPIEPPPKPPREGPLLDAHEVLRLHYNGRISLTPLQVRSASAAIGFEKPKLAAIATFNSGDDFGTQLERAIAASDAVREPRLIEGKVLGEGSKPNGHHPSPEEVSSAKMGKSFAPLRRRA